MRGEVSVNMSNREYRARNNREGEQRGCRELGFQQLCLSAEGREKVRCGSGSLIGYTQDGTRVGNQGGLRQGGGWFRVTIGHGSIADGSPWLP